MNRYERQIIIDNFGENTQEKLKRSRVLVVGAGGLGCPVLTYLTAVGIGNIVIADFDTVSESNLNRQFFYTPKHIGEKKALIAKKILSKQNPEINIFVETDKIDEDNIAKIAENCDVIIDCVDNVKTRLVLNEYCIKNDIPLVEGAVFEFYGSVTVITRKSPCLECLGYCDKVFEENANKVVGVVGSIAGVIGSLQATECIKILKGEKYLQNEILHYDGINSTFDKIKISIDKNCSVHKKITTFKKQ